MLKEGEQIVFQEDAKMLILGTMVAGGTLILTNSRLIYEKRDVTSLFSGGRVSSHLDCALSDIKNMNQGRPKVQIPMVGSNNVLFIEIIGNKTMEFAVRDPNWWYHAIKRGMDSYIQWSQQIEKQKADEEKYEGEREKREMREHELRVAQASSSHINVSPNINVGKIGDDRIDVRDSVVMNSDISTNRPPPPPPPGHNQSQEPPPPPQNSGGIACPNCNAPLQEGWKVCPACANPIDPGNKCGNCSADVQNDWKACPACGSAIGIDGHAPTCRHCGSEVQEGWKACPSCGNRV